MFGNYLGVKKPEDTGRRARGQGPPARYTRAPTSAPQDASSVRCQKCLKLGHYTYDCKNSQVYKARPSRTQQLLNPKKAKDGPSVAVPAEFGGSGQPVTSSAPLAITAGLADKILADKQKNRKRKSKRSGSSSSSSSSSSDSDSDSDSSSSSSSSSSSDSDSDSHSSSSSGSGSLRSSRSKKRKSKKRKVSRSRSPVRIRRRSNSAGSRSRNRSRSPADTGKGKGRGD